MRTLIVVIVLLLCLIGLAKPVLNISPLALGDVPPVASGQTVSAAEKELLRRWIESGAQ